jgi:hypothetical protein
MKAFKKIKLAILFLILTQNTFAQIGINSTGAAPDPKAMLDINSTTKGFLWPRMTIAQRNAISTSPGSTPEGLTVFDTDTKNLWIWKNAAWQAYLPSPWETVGVDIFNNNSGNVGIGIGTPQTKLHIYSGVNSTIRNETGGETSSLELNTNGGLYDFLEIRKHRTGASGFYGAVVTPFSIPLNGLSRITSGTFSTGGLLIGTNTANPLYFSTNLTEKMRITADGNVGVGTTLPTQKLDIEGQIRIRGASPALGKVLTSSADGTASWDNLPAGSNVWAVNGTNIYNTNIGGVGIGTNVLDAYTKLHLLGSGETHLKIESNATNQLAGVFYNNPEHSWALGLNIGNHPDGRFNLNHSVPNVINSATSLLTVSETGNVGIGSFTGAPPTERLDIKDGYIKVSGTTKSAFIITAGTGSTIFGNRVRFSYPGMSSTDILIVNHQYVGSYIGAVGNWYDTLANQWSIFREDNLAMPAGEKFTVLVIKQ